MSQNGVSWPLNVGSDTTPIGRDAVAFGQAGTEDGVR